MQKKKWKNKNWGTSFPGNDIIWKEIIRKNKEIHKKLWEI